MKNFIGCKIIKAEEMDLNTFRRLFKGEAENPPNKNQEGYHVKYPDGYDSWSPKEVFENANREISESEFDLINPPETLQPDSGDIIQGDGSVY